MKVLELRDFNKTFGEKTLFQNVNLSIATGERIGLIGRNGSGKSTFLNCVAGLDSPDSGQIMKPNDYRIYFLTQNDRFDNDKTIVETLFQDASEVMKSIAAYSRVTAEMQRNPDDDAVVQRFYRLTAEMDRLDGWTALHRAEALLNQFGVADMHARIAGLSGGERKKVAIVAALIADVDLLILDEPTNHLDVASIRILETQLKRLGCSMLFVTHDRYFLESMTNRIIELTNGTMHSYSGTYATYLEKRAEREANERAQYAKWQNAYRREYEWIKRGAKARTTKQKARIERFHDLEDTLDTNRARTDSMALGFSSERLGKTVIEPEGAAAGHGDRVLWHDFSAIITRGERIGVVGPNGSGKTTLLNVLSGRGSLLRGTMKTGETVRVAHYTQQGADIPLDKRVIEYLREFANETVVDGERISMNALLEQFLFPPQTHGMLVGKLSGGERKRLYLVRLLLERPNVLILDEPTNDFDLDTLVVLESFLDEWGGVVVTVSHDRYFLDRVTDKLWIITADGTIDVFYGDYTDYLAREVEVASKPSAPTAQRETPTPVEPVAREKKKRFGFKEQQEWAALEKRMPEL
ncbi:MAG: ABC-F family ATP-binding cassette domain-containing protein, partial [Bacilli bacterium]